MVRHYSELNQERLHQDGEALLKLLRLSQPESEDLVAFLQTLTSRTFPQVQGAPAACVRRN